MKTQVSFLKKETADGAGEPTKMCRMHVTMTKLDGTGESGTIKNFFQFPYLSGCSGDVLNDQIEIAADLMCLFSSSTDVACKSKIECDGDATWVVSIYVIIIFLYILIYL